MNKRIGQAAAVLALLRKRIWDNTMLTISKKMKVYQACVLSTLLYSSKTWTLYSCQERRLNTFHPRCLRRILGITWQDYVSNKDVVAQAGLPSMFALLNQRRLGWLGHVSRMKDWQIPTGHTGHTGHTVQQAYQVVCKRDLKAGNINPTHWEAIAADRNHWRLAEKAGVWGEEKRAVGWEDRAPTELSTEFICNNCNRACQSRIGRTATVCRRCNSTTN